VPKVRAEIIRFKPLSSVNRCIEAEIPHQRVVRLLPVNLSLFTVVALRQMALHRAMVLEVLHETEILSAISTCKLFISSE
jgi:hypothetical protein